MSAPMAHVGGLPIEEGVRALAPAVATIVYMTVGFVAWLRRH